MDPLRATLRVPVRRTVAYVVGIGTAGVLIAIAAQLPLAIGAAGGVVAGLLLAASDRR